MNLHVDVELRSPEPRPLLLHQLRTLIVSRLHHSRSKSRRVLGAMLPRPLALVLMLGAVGLLSSARPNPLPPPVPAWPEQFAAKFNVYVEQFGPKFNSTGVIFYDWTSKTFRADYIDWCVPLFYPDPGLTNFTCTFLATGGNMYYMNHTSSSWSEDECCLFAEGLGAVPPDWMKNDQYNGSATVRGMMCDVWWFPGTSDPTKPCYAYWDAQDKDHTPVRFFGLSAVGPTILDYTSFQVGPIDPTVNMSLPNKACAQQCTPPPTTKRARDSLAYPHFPSCS